MIEVLHWGALIPLAGVALLRRRSGDAWLVASAFGVSAAGDLVSRLLAHSWYPSYVWLPVQMGLVVRAVVGDTEERWTWWGVLTLAGALDVLLLGASPEYMVTLIGSAVVFTYSVRSCHRFRASILIYFGLGSALYLSMISATGSEQRSIWLAYQAARVLAWVVFLTSISARRRHETPSRSADRMAHP